LKNQNTENKSDEDEDDETIEEFQFEQTETENSFYITSSTTGACSNGGANEILAVRTDDFRELWLCINVFIRVSKENVRCMTIY
jgi:hypothetical protein